MTKQIHLLITEQKTVKSKRFMLPKVTREAIEPYTMNLHNDVYLFATRKGYSHISTTQAYRTLQKVADVLGPDDIGAHKMK
ncbi:hypothetical protein [Lysinibacillus sp. NPDC093692]|uniref:hypothetical protein n=1 Tax=Lysinibacillus sp. NPDC093692 TaxID=3390578 RepID=UPI003D04387E